MESLRLPSPVFQRSRVWKQGYIVLLNLDVWVLVALLPCLLDSTLAVGAEVETFAVATITSYQHSSFHPLHPYHVARETHCL